MRIGVVIEYFCPHRGGAEHWTWQFVEQLLARGHEVHVVATAFSPESEGLPVVVHPLEPTGSRFHLGEAAERAVRRLDVDLIHDMGTGWHCDLFHSHDGSRAAQWDRKLRLLPPWARPWKRVLTRALPRYHEFRRIMARQFAPSSTLVLALSRLVAGDLQRYHGVGAERIRLIYNGVDTQRFSPAHRATYREAFRARWNIGPAEVAFLFVGHNFALKGLPAAIRAVGRLASARRPARLIVAGGKRWAPYVRLAERHRVGDRVLFLGSVADAAPCYAAADALVLPTFSDACSLTVLEAAASGLPCVTTQFNGAAELLSQRVDGYVLSDPADDTQLAECLDTLFDDALRRRMGEAARQMALGHTLGRNCDQIEAVYREILESRK
jgi:UDP-glucose:(heptosyl)LPS alpha-1,3-glucosyltransferase